MSYVGEFHEVEEDGKLLELVYHHPKYHPMPQTQNLNSVEALNYEYYFLCPRARMHKEKAYSTTGPLVSPPGYFLSSTRTNEDHHVLPLFWCNNKEFDVTGGCSICKGSNFGTDYYFCDYCDKMYHKECVQSPPIIKHPYHLEHPLQLRFANFYERDCLCCGGIQEGLVYYCSTCSFVMHPICAMKRITFVIEPPKTHNHPLTLFLRQSSLTCNVCGLLRNIYPTYICARCNFVAHNDCMYSPRIIKISRHHHRLSYIPSLPSGEWSCGICRKKVQNDQGAYTCDNCSDYVVHSRCALRKEVWDGEDLEGVPQEHDITQDVRPPFDIISEGVILYFLHDHHLKLDINKFYDENKLCQACILPIYEGSLYTCMKCDFILHETCANSPRLIHHALHPHPLKLKVLDSGFFRCSACWRECGGFFYECLIGECDFHIDIRCGIVSEPFDYKGHEHPLFLALDSKLHPTCHVCNEKCPKQLNCIECDFIVCMKCATLPFEVRYKHDTHFLTIICGKEVRATDWCEVCEQDLGDQGRLSGLGRFTNVFYSCKECCTTFHVECLIGGNPYLKPCQLYRYGGKLIQILPKYNLSRPLCGHCHNPCQNNIFKRGSDIACSLICMYYILGNTFRFAGYTSK